MELPPPRGRHEAVQLPKGRPNRVTPRRQHSSSLTAVTRPHIPPALALRVLFVRLERIPRGRAVLNLRTAFAGVLTLVCWSSAPAGAAARTDIAARLLAMHNIERARTGAAPLQWDPQLSAAAAAYGPVLARLGRLQHSPRANRRGQSENLWMGTRGFFSPGQMVGSWIAEKRYFGGVSIQTSAPPAGGSTCRITLRSSGGARRGSAAPSIPAGTTII